MWQPDYPSLTALLVADERGEVSTEKFDDLLWYFMTERGGPAELPGNSVGPVRHYTASRLMEWEVGNGGFAQAAYNIPEWFEAAAQGYEAIGLPNAAARIREANALVNSGHAEFTRGPEATIEQVFSEFAESELAKFDEGLDSIGWWAIEERITYVRANRSAFAAAT
jgi:hypothetical protein